MIPQPDEPPKEQAQEQPDAPPEGPSRGALIALAIVVLLVAGGFWLSQRIHAASQVQDCVMAGRTNCARVGP